MINSVVDIKDFKPVNSLEESNFVNKQEEYSEYMDIILHSRNKESVIKKLKNKM